MVKSESTQVKLMQTQKVKQKKTTTFDSKKFISTAISLLCPDEGVAALSLLSVHELRLALRNPVMHKTVPPDEEDATRSENVLRQTRCKKKISR